MKLILFLVLICLPNIFCDIANNVPAVIENISEASAVRKNQKVNFKNDREDLEKYVNRSKDLGQNGDAATMDSYIAAYRLFHEEYQNIEEKKNEEIAKYNYDENIKNRKIRSVPESGAAAQVQSPAMIKFELSDAKTVETSNQHQKNQKTNGETKILYQPYKVSPAVIHDNKSLKTSDQSLAYHGNRDIINKQQRGSRDKKSTEELRMIQITHPVPTSYQTRLNRPLLDRLPVGLQKMIDIVIGSGDSKKGTKAAMFSADGKGLYKGTSNQRYATGIPGTLPNLFTPQHTPTNPIYNNFNDYPKKLTDVSNKQWWSNSENIRHKQAPTRPFQSLPQYHQFSYNEPKQVENSPIANQYGKTLSQPYIFEHQETQNQQQPQQQHYKFESLPSPQALHQAQPFQYQPQDTIQHRHQQNEFKPETNIKQADTYQQLSENYQKPQIAFLHQQPQKSSEIYQQIQQQQPTKPNSDAQEQQFIFGDYSFIPYSSIEIPILDEKIQGGAVSSTPAPIHENSEKTAEQLDNERQIPSVAALTALIGKNPSTQLKGLSELLKQEQVAPQSGRPQDNTAPILFHPNGIPPRQQPPATAIHIPKDQPAPKVISYEDFVKFYGQEKANLLLSENQFGPVQNTKQEYIAPTTIQPEFPANHQNNNHNLNTLKSEHAPMNHQQRPIGYTTPLPTPKHNKFNQRISPGHKSVTILSSPKPHLDHPKPVTYKPKQPFVQNPISNYQPERKIQKPEKSQLEEHKSEYDGNSADDLQYAAEYEFGYRVRDFNSGNDFGHQQNRDNDGVTRGEYHILLPDGRIQSVKYRADDAGFHADVSYESVD